MSCIVFTGGGTAGHVFPALAIAELLPKEIDIVWLGSKNGRDARFVASLPRVRFISIPSGKYRRYFSFKNFIDIFRIIHSFFASFFILAKLRPILLFSKGGFVSTPPCLAAYFLRIPVITHECDASPGLATKLNAFFAKKILVSYPNTINLFKKKYKKKIIYTGNPVRSIFYNSKDDNTLKHFFEMPPSKPILLVLGGSLGAAQINDLIYENIKELLKDFFIVHQTGDANIKDAQNVLDKLKKEEGDLHSSYMPTPFIKDEMPSLISSSFAVISRAGSNALWEIATLGSPMILIPLEKGSSRGDQVENALFFKENEAAIVLKGEDANSTSFMNIIKKLLKDDDFRKSLGKNAKKLSNDCVAKKIVDIIEENAKKMNK